MGTTGEPFVHGLVRCLCYLKWGATRGSSSGRGSFCFYRSLPQGHSEGGVVAGWGYFCYRCTRGDRTRTKSTIPNVHSTIIHQFRKYTSYVTQLSNRSAIPSNSINTRHQDGHIFSVTRTRDKRDMLFNRLSSKHISKHNNPSKPKAWRSTLRMFRARGLTTLQYTNDIYTNSTIKYTYPNDLT